VVTSVRQRLAEPASVHQRLSVPISGGQSLLVATRVRQCSPASGKENARLSEPSSVRQNPPEPDRAHPHSPVRSRSIVFGNLLIHPVIRIPSCLDLMGQGPIIPRPKSALDPPPRLEPSEMQVVRPDPAELVSHPSIAPTGSRRYHFSQKLLWCGPGTRCGLDAWLHVWLPVDNLALTSFFFGVFVRIAGQNRLHVVVTKGYRVSRSPPSSPPRSGIYFQKSDPRFRRRWHGPSTR
jgi:hypothetical protein